jgi:hypothetical protein
MENKIDLSQLLLNNFDEPKYETTVESRIWILHFIKLSGNLYEDLFKKLNVFPENHIDAKDICFLVKYVSNTYYDQLIKLDVYDYDFFMFFTKFTLYVLLEKYFMMEYDKSKIDKLFIMYISSFAIHKKKSISFVERIRIFYNELIKSISEPFDS